MNNTENRFDVLKSEMFFFKRAAPAAIPAGTFMSYGYIYSDVDSEDLVIRN